MPPSVNFDELEQIVRCDPGCRGVACHLHDGVLLGQRQLQQAAERFAVEAQSVAIVTGFCVHDGDQWLAETDGPPGALYLARACLALGMETRLISDCFGVPVLKAGCTAWNLPSDIIIEAPLEASTDSSEAGDVVRLDNGTLATPAIDAWSRGFLASEIGQRLTHLVSIERVGPSHTQASMAARADANSAVLETFAGAVPAEDHDRCHNMRGVVIDPHTARLHRLFELAGEQPRRITTIGMADGGNELGMGQFSWDVLRQAIRQGPADRVICRIATDFTLLAGVSNWAAYAFAAAIAALRGRRDLLPQWDAASQRELIETLVERSPVVDGVTKLHQPTVDGLSLDEYLMVLEKIHQSLRRSDR